MSNYICPHCEADISVCDHLIAACNGVAHFQYKNTIIPVVKEPEPEKDCGNCGLKEKGCVFSASGICVEWEGK